MLSSEMSSKRDLDRFVEVRAHVAQGLVFHLPRACYAIGLQLEHEVQAADAVHVARNSVMNCLRVPMCGTNSMHMTGSTVSR